MGGDFLALCLAIEELARVDSSVAITLEAAVWLGAMPIFRFGTEEQKQRVAAAAVPRRGAGGVRADRAGRRVRRRATRAPGRAGRRRVGHQRHQGVHHQLRHRHHRLVDGLGGDRRARRRPARAASIMVPVPHAGFIASNEVLQGRLARLGHPRSCPSPTAGCRPGNLLGERGRGYAQFLSILDEGRIAIARWRSAWRRAASTSRCATPSSGRRSARRSGATRRSRSRSPTWRCARTSPGCAYHDAAARMLAGRAVQAAGGDRQAVLLDDRGGQRARRDPGVRRLRVHERVPGRRGSGATRRSSRSARAPPRSSACSSPATSACRATPR